MAFEEFTGKLDAPVSTGFAAFTGKLDEPVKRKVAPEDIPATDAMGNFTNALPVAEAPAPAAPDNRSTISRIGDSLRPGFKSVLEAPATPEQQQLNADRRLGYGVGPISPETEAAAVAVRAGKEATKNKTVNKVARAMNKQGDSLFDDIVARAKDVERLQEKPETESGLSFGEEFVKGAKGAVQYALPSMARQIGLQGSAVAMMDNQKRLDLMDKIDSGIFSDLKELKKDPVYEVMRDNGSNLTLVNNYFANRNAPDVAAKMRGATTKEFQAMATDTRTHIDMLNQYAKENKEKYGPRVEKFTDINWTDPRVVADFTNWLGYNMGAGAVQMAPVMLAAVVAKQPGLLATSGAMGVSEAVGNRMKFIQDQMKGLPPEQQGSAIAKYVADTGDANLITGLVSGSFDLLLGPAAKAAKVGLSKAIGDVGLKAALKTAAKELPKDIGGEAVTGALQEITQIAAKKNLGEEGKRITRENLKDIVNAAAAEGAGAPVGTAVNLGVGAVRNLRATPQPQGRVEPSFQPEAPVNQPLLPELGGRVEPVLQSTPAPIAPSTSERIKPTLDQAPPIREEVPGMVPESDLDIQEKVTPVTLRENPNEVPELTPEQPRVDIASIKAQNTTSDGTLQAQKAAEAIIGQVEKLLARGKAISYIADGKPHNIVSVASGMMQDDKGQSWGTLRLLTDKSGSDYIKVADAQPAPVTQGVAFVPKTREEYIAEVRRQLGDLQPGDAIENDVGDRFTVEDVVRNTAGEITGFITPPSDNETGKRALIDLDGAGSHLLPSAYTDADGNKKMSQPGRVIRARLSAPVKQPAPTVGTTEEGAGDIQPPQAAPIPPPAAVTPTKAAQSIPETPVVPPAKTPKLFEPPAEQHEAVDFPTVAVPVADLKLSEDVPQFKAGATEKGVVEPLTGKFSSEGTAPIAVWRRLDGTLEVISGRHRFDLAQRSGTKFINAQVYDEAQGFTAADASILDAELNIRDEQGKVKDYVNYFKNSGTDKQTAESKGLLGRVKGKRGFAIANQGADALITALNGDQIGDEAAYYIALNAPNDERLQAVGLQAVMDGKSMNAAVNTMQAVKAMAAERDTTTDMFGFDDSLIKEAQEMAKIASKMQQSINSRLSAISGAAKNPAMAKAEGIDVRDPEAVKVRIDELKAQKAALENWSTSPELVAQIRAARGVEAPAFELKSETPEETVARESTQDAERRAAEEKTQVDNEVDFFALQPQTQDKPETPTVDMFADEAGPSAEYQAALELANRASADFRKVQEAYRKQEIGDDDFLAGKKIHDAAVSAFDKAFAKERGRGEPAAIENEIAAPTETTTPAQREEAETHAQEVGGTLVWQEGDYALIRGYSLLSGDPVYVPTMGSSRARTDIASFTGKQIPEDVKQTMVEVKQRLEEEAAAKHAANPFIVFDRGMAFSPDMPEGLANVARGWKDLLKLKPNIYISTVASAKENKDNFTGPHRRIGSAALDSNSRGSTRRMTDDSHYIVVSKSTSPTLMLEIIAHELGHIHEKEYFNQASPDVKEALKKAHAAWAKSQKGKSAKELVDSLRGRATARVMAIDPNAKADDLNPYWTSFGEWYADQTSRWALTSKSPVSVVEKFFKRLAIQLRSFYQRLRNAKYLPNETFAKYIEEATGKSVDLTPQDDRASQMATRNEDEKTGDVLEVTKTGKGANIEDDKKLVEKHNRPPTPQLDPTPTKTTLVNATKASKEYLKLSFDDPMDALGTAANAIDRGVMYARNKNVWFGSGLNAADFAKYNGQLMTSQGLATASVALDNAIRGSQIGTEVIFQGGIKFDPVSLNFVATQKPLGMRGVYEAESELKKKLGDQLGTDIIQGYLEAKRSRSIQNEFYDRQANLEALKEQYEQMLESGAPEKEIKIAKDAFVDAKTELQDIEIVFNKINMSDTEIDEFIARDKVHPELGKIMKNWSAINQNMLNFWRQVGLLSEKRYEALSNIQDYVPWQRIMNDETDIHSPVQATNRTMTNIGLERVFKKGTPTVITNFKAEEGQQDFKVQPAKVMSVEVNGKTVDPANIESLPEGKVRLNVPIAKGDLVVFTASREIENIIDNMTRNVMRMTMNGLRQYAAQRIVAEYATRNAKNQVMTFPKVDLSKGRFSFITNGKRIVVEIQDPLIAESVIGMETLGIAMFKPLAIAANITRRAITLSGAFQIKQIFKDAPTAALVTGVKNPLALMGGVYKGFVTSLLQTDPTVQILKSAGIGGFQSAARTPEAEIKRRIGIMNRNVFDFMIKGLDHIGDSSDMAQRVAVYKRVLAETGNETQALYQAANVINFLHHGSGQMAQFVVKTVPFAGAYANSIDVLAQGLAGGGLKGNSRAKNLQRLAVTGTLLTTMTLLYCMMVGDDDEYNQMDDQTKLRNFMIPGTKIMLPMNTSAAYFFKAIPEMLYNKVVKEGTNNAVDARRLRTALKEAAIDMLLGPTPVPSAVKPLLELGLNKDFFTGRPVVPDSVAKLDAAERYTAETSELGKRISALTGTAEHRLLDPIQADHIVRGIFGSAGAMAQWFSNSIGAAAGERVAPTDKQKPFVGPFLRDEVPRRNEDLFYNFKELVDNKYGTYTKMIEREDFDAADKYLDKNSDLVESHDYITEAGTELKEINSMIRYYGESKDTGLTPQERRKEIIDLQRLKQAVLDDVIEFRKNAGL